MNLAQLRTACKMRFYDQEGELVPDAQWNLYLDMSLSDVSAQSPFWPWLEARDTEVEVEAGDNSIALDDLLSVTAVWNQTNKFLLRPLVGRRQHFRVSPGYQDDERTGVPEAYRVFGSEIKVYPTPAADTAFRVEYFSTHAPLTEDTDVPPFPAHYHHLLVDLALGYAYLDDGNARAGEQYTGRGMARIADLLIAVVGLRGEEYEPVEDTFYHGVRGDD